VSVCNVRIGPALRQGIARCIAVGETRMLSMVSPAPASLLSKKIYETVIAVAARIKRMSVIGAVRAASEILFIMTAGIPQRSAPDDGSD
jgi:hypothetical protein